MIRDLVLLLAGVLAGIVATAGGIAALVSYPVLLAVGLGPVAATIAQVVAFVAILPGAVLGSRPELQHQGRWLSHWAPVAALGGAAGAGLLLVTSAGVFARIVPALLGLAGLALLLQPQLTAWRRRHQAESSPWVWGGVFFAMCLYTGYFGAGSGVMVLSLMLIAVDRRYLIANALKNVLGGVATVVAAAVFLASSHVAWAAVVPLGFGLFLGAVLGPQVARRVPSTPLRLAVAMSGIGLAVRLWLVPG